MFSKKILISAIALPSAGGLYASKTLFFGKEEKTITSNNSPAKIQSSIQEEPKTPTVEQSVPVKSKLGATISGNWSFVDSNSSGPIVPKQASKCEAMYFVEEATWTGVSELQSFKKRTKFESMEDLFEEGKLEHKWKSVTDKLNLCDIDKRYFYIGIGLGKELSWMVSSENLDRQ